MKQTKTIYTTRHATYIRRRHRRHDIPAQYIFDLHNHTHRTDLPVGAGAFAGARRTTADGMVADGMVVHEILDIGIPAYQPHVHHPYPHSAVDNACTRPAVEATAV